MWWSGIGLFICAIGLIAVGLFDPQPYTLNNTLNKMDERTITIPAEPHIEWQTDSLTTPFSRRVTFQLPTEPEIAVGVALNDGNKPLIISATNGGFVRIVHGDEVILPEQTWPLASIDPYVRGGESAEFWVDVDENGVTVRINREMLWQGTMDERWTQWGIFSDGFGRKVSGIFVRG